MGTVPVRVGKTEILVATADDDDLEVGGPEVVDLKEALSFDGVREQLEAIASELGAVWEKVQPSEAKVELGLKLSAKTGKLTALWVEAGGDASLTVSLTWKSK